MLRQPVCDLLTCELQQLLWRTQGLLLGTNLPPVCTVCYEWTIEAALQWDKCRAFQSVLLLS